MLALLDADIIAYRCAASCKDGDEEWVALARTKELVEQILHDTGATEYKLFLSGDRNFRHEIYPEYKANRKQPKPKYLAVCKNYLTDDWGAETTVGIEADDALGIAQFKRWSKPTEWDKKCLEPISTIICTIDKDLKMIPGKHYNFVKREFDTVTKAQALRTFYTSMLVGDASDNIRGVKGLGKVKAQRLLDGCESEEELFNACREQYNNDDEMILNGQLLWIWRKPDDLWKPWLHVQNAKNLNPEIHSLPDLNDQKV